MSRDEDRALVGPLWEGMALGYKAGRLLFDPILPLTWLIWVFASLDLNFFIFKVTVQLHNFKTPLLHYKLNLSRTETTCQHQNRINGLTPYNTFPSVDQTCCKLKHKVTLVLCIKLWCLDKGFPLCLFYPEPSMQGVLLVKGIHQNGKD